jgi:hypothetical protein
MSHERRFSSNGVQLTTDSKDKTVRFWKVGKGVCQNVLMGN